MYVCKIVFTFAKISDPDEMLHCICLLASRKKKKVLIADNKSVCEQKYILVTKCILIQTNLLSINYTDKKSKNTIDYFQ